MVSLANRCYYKKKPLTVDVLTVVFCELNNFNYGARIISVSDATISGSLLLTVTRASQIIELD